MDYLLKLAAVSLAIMAVCSLVRTVVGIVFDEMSMKRWDRMEQARQKMDAHVIRRDTVGLRPAPITLGKATTEQLREIFRSELRENAQPTTEEDKP